MFWWSYSFAKLSQSFVDAETIFEHLRTIRNTLDLQVEWKLWLWQRKNPPPKWPKLRNSSFKNIANILNSSPDYFNSYVGFWTIFCLHCSRSGPWKNCSKANSTDVTVKWTAWISILCKLEDVICKWNRPMLTQSLKVNIKFEGF